MEVKAERSGVRLLTGGGEEEPSDANPLIINIYSL
jgi:hypothetical protein